MNLHLFGIPLREPDNDRGEPRLSLFLVGRGKNNSYMPVPEFCSQLNEVLDQLGLGQVNISASDLIFAIRSNNRQALQRKQPPQK